MVNVLHYVLIPFKIILFIILIAIGINILRYTNDDTNISILIIIICKFFIHCLMSYNIEISDDDYNKYMKYLYSNKKFICVFNHISTIDGIALLSTFPKMGFVLNKFEEYKYINYDDFVNEKFGGIFVNSNTTNKIKNIFNNRKSGNNILFISPSAGKLPDELKNIAYFKKNGAFINKPSILPILIKFQDDSLNFYNGEKIYNRIENFIKLFLPENYNIKIKVCDMINIKKNETIKEYKDRVYNIMNQQYKDM